MITYHVDFEQVGKCGLCPDDQSLLECTRQFNVDLVSICGGIGSCGRCKVQIVSGEVSELSSDGRLVLMSRELEQGHHLACQTYPHSDVKVHIPPKSLTAPQRTEI